MATRIKTMTTTTNRVHAQPPESRDPNGVNKHITITFPDVFGEPTGTRSFDMCWDMYKTMYDCARMCGYGLMTFFSAPCIAAVWGCELGLVAMTHIWWLSPIYRALRLCIQDVFGRCFNILCDCVISPCTEALGGIFVHCRDPEWKPKDRTIRKVVRKKTKPEECKEDKEPKPTKTEPMVNTIPVAPQKSVKSIHRQLGLYM